MYQSNRSFNWSVPRATPGQPPGHLNVWRLACSNSLPRGKKAVQMNHQLVFKYVYSKTNFVFDQTLFTLFRERCAVMTPSDFFWSPFSKGYSLTKAKFYLNTEKPHRSIMPEQEINLIQISHSSKATFKFPPSWAQCKDKCPGYAGGGGWMFKLQFDRYIISAWDFSSTQAKAQGWKSFLFLVLAL